MLTTLSWRKIMMENDVERRFNLLEKRIADLEHQVQDLNKKIEPTQICRVVNENLRRQMIRRGY